MSSVDHSVVVQPEWDRVWDKHSRSVSAIDSEESSEDGSSAGWSTWASRGRIGAEAAIAGSPRILSAFWLVTGSSEDPDGLGSEIWAKVNRREAKHSKSIRPGHRTKVRKRFKKERKVKQRSFANPES